MLPADHPLQVFSALATAAIVLAAGMSTLQYSNAMKVTCDGCYGHCRDSCELQAIRLQLLPPA